MALTYLPANVWYGLKIRMGMVVKNDCDAGGFQS